MTFSVLVMPECFDNGVVAPRDVKCEVSIGPDPGPPVES